MGNVYFLHDEVNKAVKIGWAVDPVKRRGELQTGNARDLVLLGSFPGGRKAEARLHQFFRADRIRSEWFRATPRLLRHARTLLVRRGSPRTVADELRRRMSCRYGLHGVRVAARGRGLTPYAVHEAHWAADQELVCDLWPRSKVPEPYRFAEAAAPTRWRIVCVADLKPEPYPPGALVAVPAVDCFLMSRWPVVCPCWL